ncbi:AAA family ATPase [Mycobacteroides abscessus]|uniref:AAA family ATPase n=1 Tax=Mycobacteroides abscessus TaxID=36809 RepID=UPI001F1989AC|nr:ATP-dependent endonuclease [Mycobacteroides abscessus]
MYLEDERTIFVGANNSGKTSATHLFQMFLDTQQRTPFQIYDFTADCWALFDSFDPETGDPEAELPKITFDLWFEVDDDNLHRVVDLLPDLDWNGELVGVRMAYCVRNGAQLVANYAEARAKAEGESGNGQGTFRPWPQSLSEYLTKRLQHEYEIKYFLLDANQCTPDLQPRDDYSPFPLGTQSSGGSKLIDSIVKVDFLSAQRHLTDADSRGRSEDLSKRLSRFYDRNLQKLDSDLDALEVIADSEARLNAHFATVFGPTLDRLRQVGYPGVANPRLVVKASFNPYGILSTSAKIHYSVPVTAEGAPQIEHMLPDQYNGLGFKNLIYMVVELLDFHQAWADIERNRPPIHLVVIEEPEVHLHAQLQQVFIGKILEILPAPEHEFQTQLVVTTHSPHIIYESDFTPIRYFCRSSSPSGLPITEVKNLSIFYDREEKATREFLQQYIKLTHCDLFFADAALLVEGNVERLLLPLIIERFVPGLQSCHLTILEVGGAFAHKFDKLLNFLGLVSLVITDLDSVEAAPAGAASIDPADGEDADAEEDAGGKGAKAKASCPVHTAGATTSNQTLKQWIPKVSSIADLLAQDAHAKTSSDTEGRIRVAYQTKETVLWQGSSEERAGRTLEEAFALQNLEWTQSAEGKDLGLRIGKAADKSISELHDALYTRVKNFDKTQFALAVISAVEREWECPQYIIEGLTWLLEKLKPLELQVVNSAAPQTGTTA